jgi:Glycosyltransferase family 92
LNLVPQLQEEMISTPYISSQGTRAKRFWCWLNTAIAGKSAKKPPTIWLPRRITSKTARYLSVVATIKNEGRYLREWIEFQRLMGVEQVYLYDNGSTDNTNEVLAAYVAEGFVITIPWMTFDTKAHAQLQSCAHALCNFGPQFRWMAFIDLDEFVFPVTARNLVDVLSGYEDCPSLSVPRFSFGFSGHEAPPAGLIIENYTARAPYPPVPGHKKLIGYKSIVRPAEIIGVDSAHVFHLECGIKGGFDERRLLLTRSTRRENPAPGAVLRINHYFTRSRQEFAAKTSIRGDFGHFKARKKSRMANMIEHETVHDHTILRFAPALRKRISQPQSAVIKGAAFLASSAKELFQARTFGVDPPPPNSLVTEESFGRPPFSGFR